HLAERLQSTLDSDVKRCSRQSRKCGLYRAVVQIANEKRACRIGGDPQIHGGEHSKGGSFLLYQCEELRNFDRLTTDVERSEACKRVECASREMSAHVSYVMIVLAAEVGHTKRNRFAARVTQRDCLHRGSRR